MEELLQSAANFAHDYFGSRNSWANIIVVGGLALLLPALNSALKSRSSWFRASMVLRTYFGIMLVAGILAFGLGPLTYYVAPDLFEAWQPRFSNDNSFVPFNLLFSIGELMPLAFFISSAAYGAQKGVGSFALGLASGAIVAILLLALYPLAAIFAGCYGWSVCI